MKTGLLRVLVGVGEGVDLVISFYLFIFFIEELRGNLMDSFGKGNSIF